MTLKNHVIWKIKRINGASLYWYYDPSMYSLRQENYQNHRASSMLLPRFYWDGETYAFFSIRIEQWLPNGTLGEFPIQNQIIKMWKMISIIAIISLKGTSQKE